jgi:hypothetical protein
VEGFFIEFALALIVFAGSNIDDVFVLLAFFSDRRFQTKEVIVGQYCGILTLTLGSIMLSFFLKAIPDGYVGCCLFLAAAWSAAIRPAALSTTHGATAWGLCRLSSENRKQIAELCHLYLPG